jgi:hypothetical protein
MRNQMARTKYRGMLSWELMGNVIFFMGLVVTAWNIHAGVMVILMLKNFPIWVGAQIQKPLHIGESIL